MDRKLGPQVQYPQVLYNGGCRNRVYKSPLILHSEQRDASHEQGNTAWGTPAHFTPTSGLWVNQVERWFAEITDKRIRRGSFTSVFSLEKSIQES